MTVRLLILLREVGFRGPARLRGPLQHQLDRIVEDARADAGDDDLATVTAAAETASAWIARQPTPDDASFARLWRSTSSASRALPPSRT